jgi:hypothetical protein
VDFACPLAITAEIKTEMKTYYERMEVKIEDNSVKSKALWENTCTNQN